MSQQPRQSSTHSPSPAKSSSIRRPPSRGSASTLSPATAASQLPRNLPASSQFEEDPIVASHQQHAYPHSHRPSLTLNDPAYSEHAVAESEHCGQTPENRSQDLASASTAAKARGEENGNNFQPFFALIEDTVTNEHHHPTVHYIFADDDVDIVTEAALRSLEAMESGQTAGREPEGQSNTEQGRARNDAESTSRLPPTVPGTREHYIVVNVHHQSVLDAPPQLRPTAPATEEASSSSTANLPYAVSSIHSLSAEWAVLRTSISTAPTLTENEDEGLMLRIEGRGNTAVADPDKAKGREGTEVDREKETLEDMIERFKGRLEDIRGVLDAGATLNVEGERQDDPELVDED